MNTPSKCPIADKVLKALENNEFVLPSMPTWASKVHSMLDDSNVSAEQIVLALSGDPGFVAQLIKTANSAFYAGKPKVENVRAAISRLGFKMLRNLIVSICMTKLSAMSKPGMGKHIKEFWEHSREVAAISYVLSKSQKHLNPDQALLAGLTHDIGILPLFLYIDKAGLIIDKEMLELIIIKCSSKIGEKLLHTWGFSLELVEVPVAHENLQRESESPDASYADIVTVANLLNRASVNIVNWENISAVKRIGLNPTLYREFFERYDKDLRAAHEIFV